MNLRDRLDARWEREREAIGPEHAFMAAVFREPRWHGLAGPCFRRAAAARARGRLRTANTLDYLADLIDVGGIIVAFRRERAAIARNHKQERFDG